MAIAYSKQDLDVWSHLKVRTVVLWEGIWYGRSTRCVKGIVSFRAMCAAVEGKGPEYVNGEFVGLNVQCSSQLLLTV